MGLWLPKHLQRRGTSPYAQGVEVPSDFDGSIPEGFDIINLPLHPHDLPGPTLQG